MMKVVYISIERMEPKLNALKSSICISNPAAIVYHKSVKRKTHCNELAINLNLINSYCFASLPFGRSNNPQLQIQDVVEKRVANPYDHLSHAYYC